MNKLYITIMTIIVAISVIFALSTKLVMLKSENDNLNETIILMEQDYNKRFEQLQFLNGTKMEKYKYGLNGVAYDDKYYCVWTANRTTEEIQKTINHELTHVLVAKDYQHYCQK